jgi:PDZ-binding kinase
MHIPATPYLTKLGYGTGVNVYLYERSPKAGKMVSPWAVKRVAKRHEKSEFAERLEKEAAILRNLNHPNIIGYRGFTKTEADGPKNLVMEDGNQSLNDLIEKRKENLDMQFDYR